MDRMPIALADYTQDQVDALSHGQIADRLRGYDHPLLKTAADSIDYLAAQEGLLEQAQQAAARAHAELADAKQPLDEPMARLNKRVIELTAELNALRLKLPNADKYDDVLLPFLRLMRKELHANSRKGDRPGWLAMDANTLLLEVYWHAAKLSAAVKNNDGPAIMEYSADVANMAMMVLDACGGLAFVEPDPYGVPAPGEFERRQAARQMTLAARGRLRFPGDTATNGAKTVDGGQR